MSNQVSVAHWTIRLEGDQHEVARLVDHAAVVLTLEAELPVQTALAHTDLVRRSLAEARLGEAARQNPLEGRTAWSQEQEHNGSMAVQQLVVGCRVRVREGR
jgi:hypothetical protein